VNKKELTSVQKAKKQEKEKPWKTCTWYPDQCNAVGCDCGQGKCHEFKED